MLYVRFISKLEKEKEKHCIINHLVHAFMYNESRERKSLLVVYSSLPPLFAVCCAFKLNMRQRGCYSDKYSRKSILVKSPRQWFFHLLLRYDESFYVK